MLSSNLIYTNQKHNSEQPIYYVYLYLDKDTNPYYVGKGHNKRAFDNKRSNYPHDGFVVIAESGLTELGAFSIERRLIRYYGRLCDNTGILKNLTIGGDGISGYVYTEQAKAAMSKQRIGIKRSGETKAKMSKSFKGRTLSPQACKNISNGKKGKKQSKEAKLKSTRRQTMIEKWNNRSAEEILQISIKKSKANKNVKLTTEQRIELVKLKDAGMLRKDIVNYFLNNYKIQLSISSICTICKRSKALFAKELNL